MVVLVRHPVFIALLLDLLRPQLPRLIVGPSQVHRDGLEGHEPVATRLELTALRNLQVLHERPTVLAPAQLLLDLLEVSSRLLVLREALARKLALEPRQKAVANPSRLGAEEVDGAGQAWREAVGAVLPGSATDAIGLAHYLAVDLV